MKPIFLFGDSVAAGVTYDDTRSRYKLCPQGLAQSLKQNYNDVTCLARFGATLSEVITQTHALQKCQEPAIAVIGVGGNDCDFAWQEVAAHPQNVHNPKTALESFSKKLFELLCSLKQKNVTPILYSQPPIDSVWYFGFFTKKLHADPKGVMKWLNHVHRIYEWQELYSTAVVKAAMRAGCLVADARAAFLKPKSFRPLLCKDGIHPNEKGHALLSQSVLKKLREGIQP